MTYNNHLNVGSNLVKHKNKIIATNLNSFDFEKFLETMDFMEFDYGVVPPGYEHRADLISNVFYGTPTLDWLICWFNGIEDTFQQLNTLDPIKIPRI